MVDETGQHTGMTRKGYAAFEVRAGTDFEELSHVDTWYRKLL